LEGPKGKTIQKIRNAYVKTSMVIIVKDSYKNANQISATKAQEIIKH